MHEIFENFRKRWKNVISFQDTGLVKSWNSLVINFHFSRKEENSIKKKRFGYWVE